MQLFNKRNNHEENLRDLSEAKRILRRVAGRCEANLKALPLEPHYYAQTHAALRCVAAVEVLETGIKQERTGLDARGGAA